jgi:hypothetical protein
MSILHGAEARWVISGLVPVDIKHWFANDPKCRHEESRVDYYRKFIGDQFIGIKLRKYESGDQKLEFKPIF